MRRKTISALPFNVDHLHQNSTDELEEFAASFAVGSLDDAERAEFGAHIRQCQTCAKLTSEFADTAEAIDLTLEPVEATSGLKQRVLEAAVEDIPSEAKDFGEESGSSAVGATATSRTSVTEPTVISVVPRPGWISSTFSTRYQAIAAAVAVIVIGGLVAWNIVLQIDNSGDNAASTFASAEFLYDLQGTDAAPQTSGSVYRSSESVGFLLLSDLPATTTGEVYQVWRIKGVEALPEDTFLVSGSGPAIITVNADVADADTVGITIEPEGGSLVPTGDVLLLKRT